MDHFNKPGYVATWFSLINWDLANEKYLTAVGNASVG